MSEPMKTKYDRQLRIWGELGQTALENASICLLNCGPTGSEALKNLVLGGIGSITIVDGSIVEIGDLGNNFMVDEKSVVHSRSGHSGLAIKGIWQVDDNTIVFVADQDAAQEAVKKRRRATKKPYSRSIVGATLEVIQKKRAEKPEVRDAAREAAMREIKERIKKTKDEKKAKKAEFASKQQKTRAKGNIPKAAAARGLKLGGGGGKR